MRMNHRKYALVYTALLAALIAALIKACNGSKAEKQLLTDLFDKYMKEARPVLNDSDTVNVTFGLTLSQIIDVHEKNQILTISAWIRQIWNNPLLRWDPKKYNNIKGINVKPTMVWLPDIVLYNNADEDKSFGGNLDRLNTRVKLNFTGRATWLAPVILKSKCPINVKYFPFDEQRCTLKFGSWTYDGIRLDLLAESGSADLGKYSENAEWSLDGVPAVRNEVYYFCCPEPYPDVTYTVIIRRRSLFYLCNLIFPMVIIGMLTMLSFLLPAESGERVSLAITLLLAMTVFMLVVADIIPPTSETIPLVGIFFSASMVEMVVMIIVLCYIMKLYHKQTSDPPMPWWMRKYILNWLSYKIGIRQPEEPNSRDDNNEYVPMKPILDRATYSESSYRDEEMSLDNKNWITRPQVVCTRAFPNGSPRQETPRQRNGAFCTTAERPSARSTDAELILRKLDLIVEKLKEEDGDFEKLTEWRIVAMTIDKCLLFLFMIILLLTLFGCFMNSPGYVP